MNEKSWKAGSIDSENDGKPQIEASVTGSR